MKKWIIAVTLCLLAGAGIYMLQVSHSTVPVNVPREENVTLKWMIYGEKYKESDEVFSGFNELLGEYLPGVQVEFELVNKDDYKEKWDMKMATNERLDLAWFGNEVLNYTEEVKKGSLMAIDYLLETSGKDLQKDVPAELWELQRREGNIYGMPVLGPLYRRNYVLVANEVLMNRFGDLDEMVRMNQENRYTTEACFRSFEDFLQKAKENNAIGTGVSYRSMCTLADKGYEGIYGSDSPFVIPIFEKNLKVYNKYELESYRACFETMARWYQKGYIREDVKNLLDPGSEDGKLKGSILFLDEYGEKGTVTDMVKTEYDAVRGELDGYRYIPYDGCRNSLVIPKSALYPQQAMELVNLLNSEKGKELYRLLANGVEKKHYIIVEGNVIARMSDNDKSYLYQVSQNVIGNVFRNFETVEGEFRQIEVYNEEAVRSPLQGFNLDTRMIALEMAKVDLVVEKYKEELCQGTSQDWEALYEEFIREMRNAGSEKIIEEVQKQIDEFQKMKRA
ncbi:MAG: ABC transporter substrate-binding protein [Eubacteriales bacterium]|nr:ABC transporter substrate-binding protein [Eubacteriales bacterium]